MNGMATETHKPWLLILIFNRISEIYVLYKIAKLKRA